MLVHVRIFCFFVSLLKKKDQCMNALTPTYWLPKYLPAFRLVPSLQMSTVFILLKFVLICYILLHWIFNKSKTDIKLYTIFTLSVD